MSTIIYYPYTELDHLDTLPTELVLADHLDGFDRTLRNKYLEILHNHATQNNIVYRILTWQPVSSEIKQNYPNFNFVTSSAIFKSGCNWVQFEDYTVHPYLDYKNFICSFNGSPHASRKLLLSALHQSQLINPMYVSKNFEFTVDEVDGYISDECRDSSRFYRKFFLTENSQEFFASKLVFDYDDDTTLFKHNANIYKLEHKLTQSFVHLVSESMGTSYFPSVTEKFLYSVVTRGLFVTYGQLGWHDYIEKYYGFRKYDKIFNYKFDAIANPVERLVELISMIHKFKNLSVSDWQDLYNMEQDTVEFNYNHYYSGDYQRHFLNFVDE